MKEIKGAGARPGRARKANNMYRGVTDASSEESRYNVKLGKTRKQKRKLERKNTKRIRHEKKMDWLKRRKGGKTEDYEDEEDDVDEEGSDREEEEIETGPEKHQNSVEDMELEYLEHQLMKNRKGKKQGRNGKVDLLQELKSEFLNDGFDDDFLDFLSNITRIADNEVVLDRDSAPEMPQSRGIEDDDNQAEDDEEDYDEEEEEEYGDEPSSDDGNKKRVRFAPEVVKPSKPTKLDKPVKEPPSLETSRKLQIGLVNRLSEGNFAVITKELIGVYNDLIYHDMDGDENVVPESTLKSMDSLIEGLCDCIIKMVIEDVNTVISLVTIQTALICSLASNISINVGYIYCSKIRRSFDASLDVLFDNIDGEELSNSKLVARNCLISFSALFYFKIVGVDVIFDLIKSITKNDLTEHTAQLLIIILKYSGNGIKSSDDTSFNSIMEYLNSLMEGYKAVHGDLSNSRLRFVDQEIQSFKLSKTGKPLDNFEFLKNVIRDFSVQDHRIEISSDDFFKFDKEYRKGKNSPHVILGNIRSDMALVSAKSSQSSNPTTILLQKAGKLCLYSNSQKSTFIAITGSLSPVHAVERIMDLGLKSSKYPEIVSTVIRCLMAEKSFNEFYLEVTKTLCKLPSVSGKRFTRATASAVIVQIQNLEHTSTKKANLFGRYYASLILSKLLQLRILRFLDAQMPASMLSFVKIVFVHLITMTPQDMEEYVIAQFLSLESEKIFTTLTSLWKETLCSHCTNVVSELACPVILLEAAKRIFR